ncbi:hypothetical protein D3C81_1747090 [compost metagenome]
MTTIWLSTSVMPLTPRAISLASSLLTSSSTVPVSVALPFCTDTLRSSARR